MIFKLYDMNVVYFSIISKKTIDLYESAGRNEIGSITSSW